jgi:phospholipase/carboxylesterase
MRILTFSLVSIFLSSHIVSQHSTTEDEKIVVRSSVEVMDPLNEHAGDFLDVDLSAYMKRAWEAYEAGKYEEAARYYLILLKYDIRDANSIYDLACCYGLLGQAELAARYLKRAARAGFDDIEYIRQDPDFEKVRGKEVFDSEVESIKFQVEREEEGLGDMIYAHAAALFQCRVRLPQDYDATKNYPLVVGLHGRHSTPEGFITLWEGFGDPQFVYASLQAPYPVFTEEGTVYDWTRHGWTGREWRSWQSGEKEWMDQDIETTVDYVVRLVQDLGNRYSVGDVYLMGFSQGALFSYITGIYRYKLFEGLIGFSGVIERNWFPEGYLEAADGLRVFMAHGKDDQTIPYEAGIQARDILTSHGYDVTFRDFEGGHTISEEILKEVVTWITEE